MTRFVWFGVLLVPTLSIRLGPRAVAERSGPLPADAPTPPLNASKAALVSEVPASSVTASPAAPRKKLDVGFGSYEAEVDKLIGNGITMTNIGESWTPKLKTELQNNLTLSLSAGFKAAFKPLKSSIGKTWMSLPKDEQKDAYVDQLKSAFIPVFASSMETLGNHFNRTLTRLGTKTVGTEAQILEGAETSISASILADRCYDMPESKKKAGGESSFCVPSVIHALAHRLNDTQGLLSMSMRFDAGAMSPAQSKAIQDQTAEIAELTKK